MPAVLVEGFRKTPEHAVHGHKINRLDFTDTGHSVFQPYAHHRCGLPSAYETHTIRPCPAPSESPSGDPSHRSDRIILAPVPLDAARSGQLGKLLAPDDLPLAAVHSARHPDSTSGRCAPSAVFSPLLAYTSRPVMNTVPCHDIPAAGVRSIRRLQRVTIQIDDRQLSVFTSSSRIPLPCWRSKSYSPDRSDDVHFQSGVRASRWRITRTLRSASKHRTR